MSESYKAIAEYYDHEYAHLEMLQKDVPFLLSKLPAKRLSILELACGTGRAAIPLAQSGHRVVGVDYDGDILSIARRKRDFVGLTDREFKLVEGDATRVKLKERFDVVVILFNTLLTFSTLSELDAIFSTAKAHLKPGGRIWIDIFNPDLTLLSQSHCYGLDPVTFYVPSMDRTVSRVTDLEDVSPQVRKVTFHYRWFLDGEEQHEQHSFSLTWMMPRELELLLGRHGFETTETWGDYDGSQVTTQSPRIISFAKLRRSPR